MTAGAQALLSRGAGELGLTLDHRQLERFSLLADELVKWNRKVNLTAITGETEIVVKHFIDSLTGARIVAGSGMLLDLGSGGGFPALPLKILYPELEVVSVDAVEKKILFQRHVARLMGLAGFTALHVRGEALAATHGGRFDWVISRAFADLPTFARLALPLLKEDGVVVAMKGSNGGSEVEDAREQLLDLGMAVRDLQEFSLPIGGDRRSLVILEPSRVPPAQ